MLHAGADVHTATCGRPMLWQLDIPERTADHVEATLEQRKSVREVVSKRWEGSSIWSGRMMVSLGKERRKVF